MQEHAAQIEELAVVEERNRLARDLHDSVTQSLYSVTLFAQAALDRAGAGDLGQTERSLVRVVATAAQALKEMRLLVYELRPLALEEESLADALQKRLDAVERRSGTETRLIVEMNGDLNLPNGVEDELYHISQEALNNSLKHAQATMVTVRLSQAAGGNHLILEIIDDGCGFDLNAAKESAGLGLISMQERVDNLGGELMIETSAANGTCVTVDLELSP